MPGVHSRLYADLLGRDSVGIGGGGREGGRTRLDSSRKAENEGGVKLRGQRERDRQRERGSERERERERERESERGGGRGVAGRRGAALTRGVANQWPYCARRAVLGRAGVLVASAEHSRSS